MQQQQIQLDLLQDQELTPPHGQQDPQPQHVPDPQQQVAAPQPLQVVANQQEDDLSPANQAARAALLRPDTSDEESSEVSISVSLGSRDSFSSTTSNSSLDEDPDVVLRQLQAQVVRETARDLERAAATLDGLTQGVRDVAHANTLDGLTQDVRDVAHGIMRVASRISPVLPRGHQQQQQRFQQQVFPPADHDAMTPPPEPHNDTIDISSDDD
jgi:hypothetical protein